MKTDETKKDAVSSEATAATEKKVYPVTTTLENGDILVEQKDGSKVLTQVDGTIVETDVFKRSITKHVDGSETIELKSGRKAHMRVGKGKDADRAQRFVSNNQDAVDDNIFMKALMSELITIDGKKVLVEDWPEVPLNDYMQIQGRFNIVNFS